jgi:hypothetical protein
LSCAPRLAAATAAARRRHPPALATRDQAKQKKAKQKKPNRNRRRRPAPPRARVENAMRWLTRASFALIGVVLLSAIVAVAMLRKGSAAGVWRHTSGLTLTFASPV